jgi:hypothetical protein
MVMSAAGPHDAPFKNLRVALWLPQAVLEHGRAPFSREPMAKDMSATAVSMSADFGSSAWKAQAGKEGTGTAAAAAGQQRQWPHL